MSEPRKMRCLKIKIITVEERISSIPSVLITVKFGMNPPFQIQAFPTVHKWVMGNSETHLPNA